MLMNAVCLTMRTRTSWNMSDEGGEDMNWNLFWSLWCLAYAIAIWICGWAFCFRKLGIEKRCRMRTTGRVIRYSAIKQGGVNIPLVEYVVESRTYKIAGPRFRSVVTTTIASPHQPVTARYETNLTTREELPKSLRIKKYKNIIASVGVPPLDQLYPVGSPAEVYYNPDRPKEAFVQRFEGVSPILMVLFIVFGVLTTALALGILLGPEIVMK